MPQTGALPCPHCHITFDIPVADYVEGNTITCPNCDRRSQLWEVPAPSEGNLGAKVWDLKPAH